MTAARSPLRDPKWGLAWSNPSGITDQSLVMNGLLKGREDVVREAVAFHGHDYVKKMWTLLCDESDGNPHSKKLSPKFRAHIETLLTDIAASNEAKNK